MCFQLKPLRNICENFIVPELFPNVQDKELLKSVCAACKDKFLWRWVATVGGKVLHRIEGIRRWSLGCNCPHHIKEHRGDKTQSHCMRASRRLGEVVEFRTKELEKLKNEANTLTDADAENDRRTFVALRNAAQKARSLLELRTKYFLKIPWRFATADTPEGAAECIAQLQRTDPARLDPLSKRWKDTLLPDLQIVADGGPVSEKLLAEILKLLDCPLDESAGEGYHRETNMAHQRAPAMTTQTRRSAS